MQTVQVDKGAIKFVLGGANIMCPGLNHPTGGSLPSQNLPTGTAVAVMAEGKKHAIAIGSLLMDVDTMFVSFPSFSFTFPLYSFTLLLYFFTLLLHFTSLLFHFTFTPTLLFSSTLLLFFE